MSVFLTNSLRGAALALVLFTGSAHAQNHGDALALPPGENQTVAAPVAPEAMGLALPSAPAATPAPVSTLTPAPSAVDASPLAAPAQPPAAPPAAIPPAIDAKPVEAKPLSDIKPDSIGTLSRKEGGLGAGLWKGSSRLMVARLLGAQTPPYAYAALNNTLGRILLTTAGAPEGDAPKESKISLTALRVQKLIELGRSSDAWQLATLAPADQMDDGTLLTAAQYVLASADMHDACKRLPTMAKEHTGLEWQKIALVCQLQEGDSKAVQVSLDLLHSQNVQDELFFNLVEKTILGGKQLPRPLTPLKPLTLALLRIANMPLRGEIYAHPDAALTSELLNIKTADDPARLALAERAALRGLITADQMAQIYGQQPFSPAEIINAVSSTEHGPKLRALLYQAATQIADAQVKVNATIKFMSSLDSASMGGAIPPVMARMLADVPPGSEHNANSGLVIRALLLAGDGNRALSWLGLAHDASRGFPAVAGDLLAMWPLAVVSGLESEKDFPADLEAWLNASWHDPAPDDVDGKAHAARVAGMVMLMDSLGFPIRDENWARIATTGGQDKTLMPPTFVIERLRSAAAAGHKGETALLALLASAGGKEDPSLMPVLASIRALRAVGMTDEAGQLARDEMLRLMAPSGK